MKVTTDQKRLSLSFAASLGAHIALMLLVVLVTLDKPLAKKEPPHFMDVVLLDTPKSSSTKPDEDTKTFGSSNMQGDSSSATGGKTRIAKAPITGSEDNNKQKTPQSAPRTPVPPSQQQSQPKTRALTRKDSDPDAEVIPEKTTPETTPQQKPRAPIPLGKLLPSSMALAQISREFEQEQWLKQKLSREGDIPINTKEAKYAGFIHSMVMSLEEQWRPGKADYGSYDESERRVLIRLTIEHNGELGGVEILRPSPIASMNESAIRAIHEAAPFKPLPSAWGMDRANFYLSFEVYEDKFVFRTLH